MDQNYYFTSIFQYPALCEPSALCKCLLNKGLQSIKHLWKWHRFLEHRAISPDILHPLYFQTFDDVGDSYLDILINIDMDKTETREPSTCLDLRLRVFPPLPWGLQINSKACRNLWKIVFHNKPWIKYRVITFNDPVNEYGLNIRGEKVSRLKNIL